VIWRPVGWGRVEWVYRILTNSCIAHFITVLNRILVKRWWGGCTVGQYRDHRALKHFKRHTDFCIWTKLDDILLRFLQTIPDTCVAPSVVVLIRKTECFYCFDNDDDESMSFRILSEFLFVNLKNRPSFIKDIMFRTIVRPLGGSTTLGSWLIADNIITTLSVVSIGCRLLIIMFVLSLKKMCIFVSCNKSPCFVSFVKQSFSKLNLKCDHNILFFFYSIFFVIL